MTDTEKALSIVKEILMDESIKKTGKDNFNFYYLLESMKLKVKMDIAINVLNGKKEEVLGTIDRYIVALEKKIEELETKPYGTDKSVQEMLHEDYSVMQERQHHYIKGYKEITKFLKGLREKTVNPNYEEVLSYLFHQELEDDKALKRGLVSSLALGYYDMFPFDGEYIGTEMRNNAGGHYTTDHKGNEYKVNFSYVDKVANILLNKEKVKRYTDFFNKKREIALLTYELANEEDVKNLSDWYKKHQEELYQLIGQENILNNRYYSSKNTIKFYTNLKNTADTQIYNYRSNKLSELFHRKDIEECSATVDTCKEQIDKATADLEDIKAEKLKFKTMGEELLLADSLVDKISGEMFIKVNKALDAITCDAEKLIEDNKHPKAIPDLIHGLIKGFENSPARIEVFKSELANSEHELDAMHQEMTPEMQGEIEKHGWYLERIIGIKTDRVRYDMTPYVSLCILKVLSDTRHLSPEDIFEYFKPEGSYTAFSENIEKCVEKHLQDPYIVSSKNVEKTVAAKFKDLGVPAVDINQNVEEEQGMIR